MEPHSEPPHIGEFRIEMVYVINASPKESERSFGSNSHVGNSLLKAGNVEH